MDLFLQKLSYTISSIQFLLLSPTAQVWQTKSRQRVAGKMPQINSVADGTAGNTSDNAARVARVKLWSDGFMGKEESKIEDIPQREVSVFDHRAPLSLR